MLFHETSYRSEVSPVETSLQQVTRWRFTVRDYHRMGEAGILHEDDRVKLIEGEIVEMAAIGTRHFSCVNRLTRMLVMGVGDAAVVSVQNPVRLNEHTDHSGDGYRRVDHKRGGQKLLPAALPDLTPTVDEILG